MLAKSQNNRAQQFIVHNTRFFLIRDALKPFCFELKLSFFVSMSHLDPILTLINWNSPIMVLIRKSADGYSLLSHPRP